jgi:hypothetical protein
MLLPVLISGDVALGASTIKRNRSLMQSDGASGFWADQSGCNLSLSRLREDKAGACPEAGRASIKPSYPGDQLPFGARHVRSTPASGFVETGYRPTSGRGDFNQSELRYLSDHPIFFRPLPVRRRHRLARIQWLHDPDPGPHVSPLGSPRAMRTCCARASAAW